MLEQLPLGLMIAIYLFRRFSFGVYFFLSLTLCFLMFAYAIQAKFKINIWRDRCPISGILNIKFVKKKHTYFSMWTAKISFCLNLYSITKHTQKKRHVQNNGWSNKMKIIWIDRNDKIFRVFFCFFHLSFAFSSDLNSFGKSKCYFIDSNYQRQYFDLF